MTTWSQRVQRSLARRLQRLVQEPELPDEPISLPYDRSHPVLYDKDWVANCYTDDYVMALAGTGAIRLVGMTTSSSASPFNPAVSDEQFEQMVRDRAIGVEKARQSGLRHLPDPVRGTKGHLVPPPSGVVEETRPLESDGSRLIVREARRAAPDKPLVLLMCGPLTIAADAYLLDPAIAERVLIAWFGGRWQHLGDYNGSGDPWAAYIAATRMRICRFPAIRSNGRWLWSPLVPRCLLQTLPETPLQQWMLEKHHNDEQPGGFDADAPPAIALMRSDYVLRGCRMSVCGWHELAGPERRRVPALRPDARGNMLVVTAADQRIATEEWWRALASLRVDAGTVADRTLHPAGASLP